MSKLAALFENKPFNFELENGEIVELFPLNLSHLIELQYDEMVVALNEGKKIQEMSDFVAKAISLSVSNSCEEIDTIKTLPAGLQTALFEKVWELSKIKEDALGKLLETIAAAIMKAAMNNPRGMIALQALSKSSDPVGTPSTTFNA